MVKQDLAFRASFCSFHFVLLLLLCAMMVVLVVYLWNKVDFYMSLISGEIWLSSLNQDGHKLECAAIEIS